MRRVRVPAADNDEAAVLLVTRGALLEVGLPDVAAAVSVRRRGGLLPFPTFAGSGVTFETLPSDEREMAERAFMLGHQVHDWTARLSAPIENGQRAVLCAACDDAYRAAYAGD